MLPYKHFFGEICVCNNSSHRLQENAYRKVFGLKKFLDERSWTPLLNMEFWGIWKNRLTLVASSKKDSFLLQVRIWNILSYRLQKDAYMDVRGFKMSLESGFGLPSFNSLRLPSYSFKKLNQY
jgi:hypothetical protein